MDEPDHEPNHSTSYVMLFGYFFSSLLGKVRIASDLDSRLITALACLGEQATVAIDLRSVHPPTGPGAFHLLLPALRAPALASVP
jgi:hypothetical protein